VSGCFWVSKLLVELCDGFEVTQNCVIALGSVVKVEQEVEVFGFHLVNKPSSVFDMRGCVGRRCGR